MIRRNPTLISMSDLDVQDVRDLVAKQKDDSQKTLLRLKHIAEKPLDRTDISLFLQLKDAKEQRQLKDARLGLPVQAGPSTASISGAGPSSATS